MKTIERRVYNIAVLVTPEQGDELVVQLEQAGLRLADDTAERNVGLRSRLLPIAGGGFIEVSCELSPGSFVHGNPFTLTPRPALLTFTTADGAADLAYWRGMPGTENAFAQAGSWRRQDGTFGYYTGVMPGPPTGALFFGLQERRLFPPVYAAEADTAPAVRRLRMRGPNAAQLRKQHADWFSLPERNGNLHAGETELIFETADIAMDELFVTLAVPNPDVTIRMAAGGIDFVQA